MLVVEALAAQSRREPTLGENQMTTYLPSESKFQFRVNLSVIQIRNSFSESDLFSLIFASLPFCSLLKFSSPQSKRAQAEPAGGDQELDEERLLLQSKPPQEQVLAPQPQRFQVPPLGAQPEHLSSDSWS